MNRITITISRATWELFDRHATPGRGRDLSETVFNADGSVTFPVTKDTLARVESIAQPGESISDTLARVLSTSH